jgi:hypothetical protein
LPRPEVIKPGSTPSPPFWKRVRRRVRRAWADVRLARRKRAHRQRSGVVHPPSVAYVLGCQRSGTNMILRSLNRSMDIDVVEESDRRCFDDCRILDLSVRRVLLSRSTAKCVVFKPICDSHRATELLCDHPGSRIVWVFRNYRDVANSAVEYWGDQILAFVQDVLEGGGDWGVRHWNREKITDECLAEVQSASVDGLNAHSAACLFWYMRNRTFFEQRLSADPAVALVRYEDAVLKPEAEFRRLCEFLKVAFDHLMIRDVSAGSIRKRSTPGISKAVEDLCEAMLARLAGARAEHTGTNSAREDITVHAPVQ